MKTILAQAAATDVPIVRLLMLSATLFATFRREGPIAIGALGVCHLPCVIPRQLVIVKESKLLRSN
jgi:hypothetical protein